MYEGFLYEESCFEKVLMFLYLKETRRFGKSPLVSYQRVICATDERVLSETSRFFLLQEHEHFSKQFSSLRMAISVTKTAINMGPA